MDPTIIDTSLSAGGSDPAMADYFASAIDTSYNAPVSTQTVAPDIATQAAAVPAVPQNDAWTSFFQKTLGTVVNSAVAQSNVKTAAQVQQGRMLTPGQSLGAQLGLGGKAGGAGSAGGSSMLLIAVAVVVALLVLKK